MISFKKLYTRSFSKCKALTFLWISNLIPLLFFFIISFNQRKQLIICHAIKMIKSPLKSNRKKYQKLSSHSDSELNVNRSSCSCGQNSKELNFNLLSEFGDSRKIEKPKYTTHLPLRIQDEVKIDLRKVENISPVSSYRSLFRIYPIEELSENESFTKRSNKMRIKQDQTDQINRILELSKKSAKFRPIKNNNNSQQDNIHLRTVPYMKEQCFEVLDNNKDCDKYLKAIKFDASSQTGSLLSYNGSPLGQTISNEVIEFQNSNFRNPNNMHSSSSFNSFNNNISNYTQDESVSSRSCLSFRKLFSCAFLQKSTFRKYHNK